MGFVYALSTITGRNNLCCDFCDKYGKENKVYKKKCPFDYCQAYAICKDCRIKYKDWKALHIKNKCDTYSKEYDLREIKKKELLDNGKFLLISCIGLNEMKVKAIFTNKDNKEKTLIIDSNLYNSVKRYPYIPIIEDYENLIKPIKPIN